MRTVYILRVPLIILAILFLLGFAATISPAASLLSNLLDQDQSFWGVCAVCFCGFLVSAVAIVCINQYLHYGEERLSDPNVSLNPHRQLLVFTLGALPSFVLAGFVEQATPLNLWLKLAAIALAILFAIVAGLLAKAGQLLLWDPKLKDLEDEQSPPDLLLPVGRYYGDAGIIRWLLENRRLPQLRSLFDWLAQPFLWILEKSGPGYVFRTPNGRRHLESGHQYAAFLASITFLIWYGFGLFKQAVLTNPDAPRWIHFMAGLPALAYLLILLMLVCWVLTFFSFFFDRYRLPFTWIVAILALFTWFAPESDHFFHVERLCNSCVDQFPFPSDILKLRSATGKKRFVLVSTAGGGIQAAAWTAKVLTEIETAQPQFRDSLLLISSVSGGSVGSLAYARTFDQGRPKFGANLKDVVTSTEKGALDSVAWGWFNPDVARAVTPWFRDPMIDRGWAVERSWTSFFDMRQITLADWAAQAKLTMPALIYNASIVETGHPVVFSTTRFPTDKSHSGISDFHRVYAERTDARHLDAYTYDLPVVTAARLSASFPYVAPAARPDLFPPHTPDYHYVDGGYYDNYGITTLIAWLEEALPACPDCRFLLLRVTHFPQSPDPSTATEGWGFQIYAPVQGQYDAREAGQIVGDDTEVRLKAAILNGQLLGAAIGYQPAKQNLNACGNPPLSWQLSQAQIDCISSTWNAPQDPKTQLDALQCVADFTAGNDTPTCTDLATTGLLQEKNNAAGKLTKP